MRQIIGTIIMLLCINAKAEKTYQLEQYVSDFNYKTRKDMKIDSKSLISLIKAGKAELIDIRFREEFSTWRFEFSKNIPLNELPKRLNEIDKSKIIVTSCPHKDRAIIAMVYLRSLGIKAKYLKDGLLGLMENLRGDDAKEFILSIKRNKKQGEIK